MQIHGGVVDNFLIRDSHNQYGTFGKWIIGLHEFETVEQDWENNLPNISCVPNGEYKLTFHISPHHGECYILENKELGIGKNKGDAKRFGCLLHIANLASQLEGCIAPGLYRSYYKGQWSVASSGTAMDRIFEILGKDPEVEHRLIISKNFPSFEVTP